MIQKFSYHTSSTEHRAIDIAFSKTNRKTPTVIRARFEVSRIRSFYVRKVRHSSTEFSRRLAAIVAEFPVLEKPPSILCRFAWCFI